MVLYFAAFGAQHSVGQPLPNLGEVLEAESQAFSIKVPEQDGLVGGHLQGIQLSNDRLFVSGSSKAFGYLATFRKVDDRFQFVGVKKLGKAPTNHAGGFQIADNWLAVGVEDPKSKKHSVIQLLDISSFESFSKPPIYLLERTGDWKLSTAGAVGIIKRKDHFLLAVGTWDCTTIDFYVSNHLDPNSKDFEFSQWTVWDSRAAVRKKWVDKSYGNYQNLQLSEDSTGLYITGFCRTKKGANRADVYRMFVNSNPYDLMEKVATYTVQCKGDVTFRNGAGFGTYNDKSSIISVGSSLYPATQVQISPIKDY